SEGCLRILLDERGDALTTAALRERVDRWEGQGVKSAAFLIGGAEGHGEKIRGAADLVLGLSAFTLQHELALVVLAEQLYRVYTMKRGESYHR
ncbi:MAG: 23S rRNA (pseudouridine(1915)-N(3))-methyltransferase RlmH, partial [Verrucomicrobiales bacterium]